MDDITDSMDMSLSKLREKDREAWCAPWDGETCTDWRGVLEEEVMELSIWMRAGKRRRN